LATLDGGHCVPYFLSLISCKKHNNMISCHVKSSFTDEYYACLQQCQTRRPSNTPLPPPSKTENAYPHSLLYIVRSCSKFKPNPTDSTLLGQSREPTQTKCRGDNEKRTPIRAPTQPHCSIIRPNTLNRREAPRLNLPQ
jgi:hypothetical protein